MYLHFILNFVYPSFGLPSLKSHVRLLLFLQQGNIVLRYVNFTFLNTSLFSPIYFNTILFLIFISVILHSAFSSTTRFKNFLDNFPLYIPVVHVFPPYSDMLQTHFINNIFLTETSSLPVIGSFLLIKAIFSIVIVVFCVFYTPAHLLLCYHVIKLFNFLQILLL